MAQVNKKRYYYLEINIPDAVKDARPGRDAIAIMHDLTEEYKNEVGTKYARALNDFIFGTAKHYGWHPTDANRTATCVQFINARHFANYEAYTADFRQWLENNHGITYPYETYTDVPYEIADVDNGNDAEIQSEQGNYFTYAQAKQKAIMEDLPEERGFVIA